MGSDRGDRLNLFAAVIYLPDPLATYLDELRKELAPKCIPHAHVSVLPPRPLITMPEAACERAQSLAKEFAPFEIEARQIEIFPITEVIYVGIGAGNTELREMHRAFNSGSLAFEEAFRYHPHITLAQDLETGSLERLGQVARRRWADCPYPRSFRAESITFVQATECQGWVDLAEFSLGPSVCPESVTQRA